MITNDKKLPNLKVLRPLRVKGEHYRPGDVVAKSAFAVAGDDRTGDWMDLCAMEPPSLVQTDEPVSRGEKPKKAKRSVAPAAPVAPAV
jgi:hypothetical protein